MIAEPRQQQPLTKIPTEELFRIYRADPTVAARNDLVIRHVEFARHLAIKLKRSVPMRIDLDELMSDATIGLMRAVEGFDPSRGHHFATFAGPRIWGAMLDGLRSREWAPRSVRRQGETPRRMVSMSSRAHTRNGDGQSLAEIVQIPDRSQADPCHEVIASDRKRALVRFVNKRRRLILAMFYFDDFTAREIGHLVGVTKCRIEQELRASLIQLRARKWRIAAEGE